MYMYLYIYTCTSHCTCVWIQCINVHVFVLVTHIGFVWYEVTHVVCKYQFGLLLFPSH